MKESPARRGRSSPAAERPIRNRDGGESHGSDDRPHARGGAGAVGARARAPPVRAKLPRRRAQSGLSCTLLASARARCARAGPAGKRGAPLASPHPAAKVGRHAAPPAAASALLSLASPASAVSVDRVHRLGLTAPDLRGGAGGRRAPLHRRARRPIRILDNGQLRSTPFLDISGRVDDRGRGRPPRPRLRAGLRDHAARSTSTTRDAAPRSRAASRASARAPRTRTCRGDRRRRSCSRCRSRRPTTTRAARSRSAPTACSTWASATAAAAATRRSAPRTRATLLGKMIRIDVVLLGVHGRLPHPLRQPLRREHRHRARDLGARASATRSASASTARRATSTSATWARDDLEEVDVESVRARPAAGTTAGT